MTDLETREYLSMLKSQSADQSTISVLTDENTKSTKRIHLNFDPKYLTKVITESVTLSPKLNFSAGRAADVARRLIHDHDIQEAREARQKLENANKLTAMLNFNTIGCKVREDSLKIRWDTAQKKERM